MSKIFIFQMSLYFLSYPRKKGFTLMGSKITSCKNNILLFFIKYIQLMIFVALPTGRKPKQYQFTILVQSSELKTCFHYPGSKGFRGSKTKPERPKPKKPSAGQASKAKFPLFALFAGLSCRETSDPG